MKKIRNKTFETNSSSTHALTQSNINNNEYLPFGDTLKIKFFDEERTCATLAEKVSYLVSHIISWYKYDVEDYDDLIRQVEENWDFKRIKYYIQDVYGKEIVFPKKYDGDIEDIVIINHQLQSWNRNLDEVLNDIINEDRDLLDEVLNSNKAIVFGRD